MEELMLFDLKRPDLRDHEHTAIRLVQPARYTRMNRIHKKKTHLLLYLSMRLFFYSHAKMMNLIIACFF